MKFRHMFIMAIAFLLCITAGAAMAEESDFVIEDGVLTKYIGDSAEVVIPDDVTSIGEDAFMGKTCVESVIVPEGVTYIGETAFCFCDNLTYISLPDSLETMEQNIFAYCSSLESITIPANVEVMFNALGQSTIKTLTFAEGLTAIPSSAFTYDSITTVNFPSTLTSIGYNAFAYSDLTSVTIPAGVTEIDEAFYHCGDLTTVTFAEGMKTIPAEALYGASSVTTVNIPSTVTAIGNGAFQNCSNLTSISLPSGLTSIGVDAIRNSGITSITIPASVTDMDYSLRNCNALTTVIFAEGMTTIPECALFNAEKVTSVTIPSTVTTISSSAFSNCTSLNSIDLPAGLTTLGSGAFTNTGIGSVTIPAGVTSMQNAFSQCSNLTTVTFADGMKAIPKSALKGYSYVTGVIIPDSVTSIGDYAFEDCTGITSIDLPSGLTSIGYCAFEGTGLTSVSLPAGVTFIGNYAFAYTDIENVVIPAGAADMDGYAFYNCSSLEWMVFAGGSLSEGNGDFYSYLYPNTTIFWPDGAIAAGKVYNFEGSSSVTVDNWNTARVYSVKAEKNTVKQEENAVITVIGNSKIAALGCTASDGAVQVSETCETVGMLKIWTLTYEFAKPGDYSLKFYNRADSGKPSATTNIRVSTGYSVFSAEFNNAEYMANSPAFITVYTDLGATSLTMFSGSKAVKTWNTEDAYPYVSNGTLRWNISHTFTGAGERTMTFKASDGTNYCPGVDAKVTILTDKKFNVTSAYFKSSYVAKGTAVTATVKTEKDAKYLAMYSGTSKIKTWAAADYSTLSGDTRVWTVKYTFSGAGSRTMTFKASYDNKAFGEGKDANIVVTSGSDYNVASAAFNSDYYAKGTATTATVTTGLDAKYLTMYSGSSKVKTWAAADYSSVSGTERIWIVNYTFSGTGSRKLTFKATKDKATYGTGKSATVLITSGNSINVTSAKFASDYIAKGVSVTITVKTGADAKYLAMYNGSSKLKTWKAADYSKISGTTRVWTVKYSFSGTGTKKMTFKASKDNKTFGTAKTASILATSGNSINVTSAKFSAEYAVKGTSVTATVKTGADAKYLVMYNGTSKIKSWTAADNSKISGTTRVWTVTYSFSGSGLKDMTFKASKDNKTFGTAKNATILITSGSSIEVNSAKFAESTIVKGTAVTITVKTGADAQYLAMYTESGSKAKTWKAADYSKISGKERVWTITYTFSGAGERTMTFKASKDNSTFGTGKSANITITAE